MTPRNLAIVLSPFLIAAGPCSKLARAAEALEPGFDVERYIDGLEEPVAMAFDPEGRLFIAEKSGTVRIALRGELRDEPVAVVPVFDFFECGLLGMALDPNYSSSPYLYVFATVSNSEQQIIRYRIVNGTGVEATVLRDHIPSGGTIHNGGCLRFGPDGMIYFSVGDNGFAANAQSDMTLAGKVCRIMPDGETPDDNPFTTITGARSAVYARGFRNPFRFCFSADGRLYLTDVGSSGDARREEINVVESGFNYGWPEVEGAGGGYEAPLHAYSTEGQCVTGIVSYRGSHFPETHRNNLFYLDFTLSKVFRMVTDGVNVQSNALFVQAEGSTVDITEGPDGRLYYCESTTGRIRRIVYPENETTDPGADVEDGDWGGDDESTLPNNNDNENDNTNGGGNGPASFFDLLCGGGAATATAVPLVAMMIFMARPRRTRRRR